MKARRRRRGKVDGATRATRVTRAATRAATRTGSDFEADASMSPRRRRGTGAPPEAVRDCAGARPLLASSWRRPSRPDPPRSSSKRTCAPQPRSPPHRPHAGCWRRGGAQRGAHGVHTPEHEPVTHGPGMLLPPLGSVYQHLGRGGGLAEALQLRAGASWAGFAPAEAGASRAGPSRRGARIGAA